MASTLRQAWIADRSLTEGGGFPWAGAQPTGDRGSHTIDARRGLHSQIAAEHIHPCAQRVMGRELLQETGTASMSAETSLSYAASTSAVRVGKWR